MTEILNILFVITFILFLPGLMVSYLFFNKGKIDFVERIALSFALSIAIVPLIVFYMNLLGIPINKMSVIYQVLMVISIAGIGVFIKKLIWGKH